MCGIIFAHSTLGLKLFHMGKLTDIKCRAAKCSGQKIIKLGDGDGLYLWVHDSGRKHWHFRYTFGGKAKGLNLGLYPEVSLGDARKRARDQRDVLDRGEDPSLARKRAKREARIETCNTFQSVATEWFNKVSRTWTEKHAQDVKRRLELNIYPTLGARPIHEIDGPELLATLAIMEKRGATDLAHRVNGVCGQVFRYGIATGRCKFDIAASVVDALTPHIKTPQASVDVKQIPALMQKIATYDLLGKVQTKLAILLLAHTFTRTGELINAKRDEFDLQENLWEIPAERMKLRRAHLVPLTSEVKLIVQQLFAIAGRSELLLPGRSLYKPISNNTILKALERLGYKHVMTGHGFRSMASTVLNENGWNKDWIEKQLAHEEENKVRGAYNRAEYLSGRRKMMQWWSDYLVAAEKGSKLPESVGD